MFFIKIQDLIGFVSEYNSNFNLVTILDLKQQYTVYMDKNLLMQQVQFPNWYKCIYPSSEIQYENLILT